MKGVVVLGLDATNLAFWADLKREFKRVGVFCAVENELSREFTGFEVKTSFAKSDGLGVFAKNENEFWRKIIADYEDFAKNCDFVMVLGVREFGVCGEFEFNANLAKELNLGVFAVADKPKKATAQSFLSLNLGENLFIVAEKNENLESKFKEFLQLKTPEFCTPNRFFNELLKRAKNKKQSIVLPESDDERILRASAQLLGLGAVKIILLGDESKVRADAAALNLDINSSDLSIINPVNSTLCGEFATTLFEARKNKGMSEDEAAKLVRDRTYFGTMLVHTNRAAAMVSGASTTTAETIRPALQLIKTRDGVSIVSGAFFMCLNTRVWLFADCAVTPNPTPSQIAEIAFTSAKTAQSFGLEPRIAILSYSTGNSGSGVSVDATREAVNLAREKYPEILVDGPLQFDAAVDIYTAKTKMPNSKVAGMANVFIFPDLNAANIAYKAVQRSANALAIGPVLQGLKKPVNDLSRGCLVEDIVLTAIVSAIQAG